MKALIRLLPLAIALLGLWLLLNDSLSRAQILLGLAIAVTLSALAPILRPQRARPSHLWVALRLTGQVAADIVVSNYAVGRRILRCHKEPAQSGFLDIPLRIHDPHGLAALACIVTFTPGTVWAGHDPATNTLTLHVLDLHDPAGLRRTIQERYERPLREIFE